MDGSKSDEAHGKGVIAYFSFEDDGQPLEARVSLSSVDGEGASINMTELEEYESFESVVDAAAKEWEQELSVIEIETDDETVLHNFYSAFYHTKIAPMVFSDLDGRCRGIDQEIHPADGHLQELVSIDDHSGASQGGHMGPGPVPKFP